ncbi:MAG: NIPSNAP family protein [Vicinamibacterales bacterium]
MRATFLALVLLCLRASTATAQSTPANANKTATPVTHLNDFQIIELRRYTIKLERRGHFAQYFETYFPEAFQQLGAMALGQFLERDNKDHFLWLRAFRDMDERAKANSAFYYGPVWKEHRSTLNALIDDSDNVLLLRPLDAQRPVTVLPAVDPVTEPGGAGGIAAALIFPVHAGRAEQFAREAQATFAQFEAAGVREAGLLCSLDAQNNFPQLPIRTDGPFVVWLGVMQDERALKDRFLPLEERARRHLEKSQLLSGPVELVVLTPTRRSRLRWVTP